MSLKKECLYKSLKEDWSIIGIISCIVAICLSIIYGIVYYSKPIGELFIAIGGLFTAVNCFIMFNCAMLGFALLMLWASDKANIMDKETTFGALVGILSGYGIILLAYCLESYRITHPINWGIGKAPIVGNPFPDVFPILIGFIILSVVIIPIAVAVKRCWE